MIGRIKLSTPNKNENKLVRHLATIVGFEISSISKPCFVPKIIKYKTDLMNDLGVHGTDIKYFLKNLDDKYSSFDIFSDQLTISLIISMLYYSQQQKHEISKLLFHFLAIKFYSSLFHISFPKFCSEILWNKTLNRVSTKHLFREKNGVANTINYLVDIIYERYRVQISKDEIADYDAIRMVYDMRHRISQSLKSFAEAYYAIQKSGGVSKTEEGEGEDEGDNLVLLAEKISMSICTYSTVDMEALDLAISKSGFKKEVGRTIIREISDVDYREKLRFILILIGKIAPYKYICRESHKNTMIRKIAANKEQVGNYVVFDEIMKFLKETKFGYRLHGYQEKQVVIFFMHYLLKFIQTKVCSSSTN